MDEKKEVHLSVKENKKKLIQNFVLVVTSLFVLILASIAWFLNNSQVDISGITISSDNKSFELKSSGKSGVHNDIISNFFSSGTNNSIDWLMSGDSNIGNYNENEEDVDFSENDRKDYAIEPGAEGNLSFSIIPKNSGTQTFHLNLSMIPYVADIDTSTKEIKSVTEVGKEGDKMDANNYARQFLAGHILFYLQSETADGETEYTWMKEGTFDITIKDAVINQEYEYTVHWLWPLVFSEIILKNEDPYLNGHTPIFPENEELREEILEDMKENPQKYFYNSLTQSPLEKENQLISGENGIDDIHDNSPTIEGDMAQNFVDLSSFYNQADQIIGSQISFVLVELSAELGGIAE